MRIFLILFLKHDRLLDARISSSSEFHKDIDDGIQDLHEISVLVNGTVRFLLFRRE